MSRSWPGDLVGISRQEERDLSPPVTPALSPCFASLLPSTAFQPPPPPGGTLGSSRRPSCLLTSLRMEAQDSEEETAKGQRSSGPERTPLHTSPSSRGPFDPSGPAPASPGPAPARPGPALPRRHLHHEDVQ